MSFDELLKSIGNFQLASELPDTIVARIDDIRVETVKKYGKNIRRIRVQLRVLGPEDYEDINTVTTWPVSLWPVLFDLFKRHGFNGPDELVGTIWTFKKQIIGRVQFPRHIPVEYVGTEEEEEEEEPEPKPKPKRKSKSKKANPSGDIL